MLNITDLSKLEVTRVRPWAILFDYDGKHYLLHGTSDDWTCETLYERTLDEHGKYELEHIGHMPNGYAYIDRKYIKTQKGDTIVYKLIDKEYFVFQLVKSGLVSGLFEKELENYRNKKDVYKKIIRDKENELRNLKIKLNNLERLTPEDLREI